MKKFAIGVLAFSLFMSSTVIYAKTKRTIEVIFGQVKIVVNGKLLNNETLLYDGTTYVPLRAVGEALGQRVEYIDSTKTAYFYSQDQIIVNEPTQPPNHTFEVIPTKTPSPTFEVVPTQTPTPTFEVLETQTPSPTFEVIPNEMSVYDMADQVLSLVNEERQKVGLNPLLKNDALFDAAMLRAFELESLFSHDRPDGSSCFTVLDEFPIARYGAAGENIAAGQSSAVSVMNSWMNSAGHKQNILSSSFDTIGIGCYMSSQGQLYWVQLFTGSR